MAAKKVGLGSKVGTGLATATGVAETENGTKTCEAPKGGVEPRIGEQTAMHRRLVPPGQSSTMHVSFESKPACLRIYDLKMRRIQMERGELPEMTAPGHCRQKKKKDEERAEAFEEHAGNVFVGGTHDRVAEFHLSQRRKADSYENYRWEEREFDDRLASEEMAEDRMIEDRRADELQADDQLADRQAVDDALDTLEQEQQLLEERWAAEKRDDGLFTDETYQRQRDDLLASGDPIDTQELLELDRERERADEDVLREERSRTYGEQQREDQWRQDLDYYDHNDALMRRD